MLTNAHFGCRIFKLQEQEKLELRRSCESAALRKLDFSITFLRKVMRALKEMLGLGLFIPSSVIAVQKLRLFLEIKG